MKTVDFQIQESIPVIAETDVLVVGGGAGGFAAAVMAARCGAETILADQHGSLGGTTTYAEISPMMPNDYSPDGIREHAEPLDGPVYIEWLQKMYCCLPPELRAACSDVKHRNGKNRVVSKDVAALAMEELCQEAGVQLLYHFSLFRLLSPCYTCSPQSLCEGRWSFAGSVSTNLISYILLPASPFAV